MSTERVDAEHPPLLRGGEQLLGDLDGQLVRGHLGGQVGPLQLLRSIGTGDVAFEVRPEPADPHEHRAALVVVEQFDGVDLAGVDLLEVDTDEFLEAAGPRDVGLSGVTAEIELGEPVGAVLVARGDLVEIVLQRGGEVVVNEAVEIAFEQPDHGERHP